MESVVRMIPSDNPATYCRLCFVDKNLIPLFPGRGGSKHSLVQQISQCIGIQIEPGMDGSCSICWRCAVVLEDFQLLRQRSLDHDSIIRNSRKGHAFEIVAVKEEHDEPEVMFVDQFEPTATSSSWVNSIENDVEVAATFNNQNSDSNDICYESVTINEVPTCNFCSIEFKTRASLNLHCKEQHSNGIRPFSCALCPAHFKRKGHLERHMETHTGIKRYACNVCDASFARAKTLDRHMQSKHENVSYSTKKPASERAPNHTMKCPFCTEMFDSDQLLNTHIKSHKDSLPHVCHLCDARFAQMLGLTIHMGKFHPEVSSQYNANIPPLMKVMPSGQKLDCELCPRKFNKFEYLKEHLEAVHRVIVPDLENSESNCLEISEITSQDELPLELKAEIADTQLQEEQLDE
uniref:Zinc finger and BTB domain-containing protein 40 n=1 Tax=Culex pipiens TaxID=7175 RepID=A0A8D8K1S9_CULPI